MRIKRIDTVNAAIATFAPGTTVTFGPKGQPEISWKRSSGEAFKRRWAVERGTFYPIWEKSWPHGGTCCIALCQLVRWVKGDPVFGLSTWEYWCGPGVRLGTEETVQILKRGRYPAEQICVRCGQVISLGDGLDWTFAKGKSGPVCARNETCIGKIGTAKGDKIEIN